MECRGGVITLLVCVMHVKEEGGGEGGRVHGNVLHLSLT